MNSNIVLKNSDLRKYFDKIDGFFMKKFGKLVSHKIFSIYESKLNVKIEDFKDVKELMEFSNELIHDVFIKHKNEQEVEAIKLQLNLQFCVDKATDVVSSMIPDKISFEELKIEHISRKYFMEYLKDLTDELILTVNVKGMVEGKSIFFYDKKSASDLSNELLKTMMGMESTSKDFDEMKISALKEFLNMLIPSFVDTIANTLKKSLMFVYEENEDIMDTEAHKEKFKKEIGSKLEQKSVQKVLRASLNFNVGVNKVKQDIIFLVDKIENVLDNNVNKLDLEMDNKSAKLKEQIEMIRNEYLNFLKEYVPDVSPVETLNSALKKMNIKSLAGLKKGHINSFVDFLKVHYLLSKTSNIQTFVTNGVRKILEKVVELNEKTKDGKGK